MPNTKPTILCLVNMAAYSRKFFERLSEHLESRGIDVVFALDSHFSDYVYGDGSLIPDAYYFTDYCISQVEAGVPRTERDDAQWACLYPDFDRFLTINIPLPLKGNRKLAFRQIPGLLRSFFEKVFAEVEPVAVLYEQASNSFALAALEESRKRGIPFLSLANSRISGRIEVSQTGAIGDCISIDRLYSKIREHGCPIEIQRSAQDYIDNIETEVPGYMQAGGSGNLLGRVSILEKYFRIEKLLHLLRSAKYTIRAREDVKFAYMHGSAMAVSFSLFRRSMWRQFRLNKVRKYFNPFRENGPYFLYPLHFHPEASTSVLAPDYVDELGVIKAIAFRLPAHVVLAVKEHPSAVGLQPLSFYRQLNDLPNVILVGPDEDTKEMARRSLGVVCLTSTLGFEAAVMNKPVIALGDVFYGYFPNVRMADSYRQLPAALSWAMSYEPIEQEELRSAVGAYFAYTEQGTFDFRQSFADQEALDNIAEIISRRLAGDGVLTDQGPAGYLQ